MLWWLRRSEPLVPVRLIALDKVAKAAFIPTPQLSILHFQEAKKPTVNFGTREYAELMVARVQILRKVVHSSATPVLLLDTDVVPLAPFIDHLLKQYPASEYDFVTQRGMSRISPHNGGLILWHPTERTRRFIAEYARVCNKYTGKTYLPTADQGVLNSLIKQDYASVSVALLPNSTFPVGGVYFGDQRRWPPLNIPLERDQLPSAARLVHNNCIVGLQSKIARLKHYGLWNVTQARAAGIIQT